MSLQVPSGPTRSDSLLIKCKKVPTRVVELSSLSNAQTTTTNDQDLLDIDRICSSLHNTTFQVCLGTWCSLCLIPADSRAREKSDVSGTLASQYLTLSIEASCRGLGSESPRRSWWSNLAEDGAGASCKTDGESHCAGADFNWIYKTFN